MAEVEIAGAKIKGAKILLILPILGTLGGGLWGGFEFYKDYMNMREKIEEKIAQWVDDLERNPHYPYLDKIVTDEDVEKLCEVVEKMFDK